MARVQLIEDSVMAHRNFDRTPAPDHPLVIGSASFLISINALIVNVQPIIMGALAEGRGLSDANLGQISAIFVGFNTLCMISAPLWLRSLDWRKVSLLALAAATVIMFCGGWARTLPTLLLVFAALGVAKGFLGAVAFAALGDSDNPARAFGVAVAAQSLLAAVAAAPLSVWVLPQYGVTGLFWTLSALLAVGLGPCLLMPANSSGKGSASMSSDGLSITSAAARPVLVALFASGLFVAGIVGFWYFMERIGTARGSSAGLVGLAVSLCALATILTAVIVTWLGGRFSSLVFVFGGTGLVLAAFALLLAPGDVAFMASCMLFALGWGLAQPAYWAVVRKVDMTNRLFAAAPAASGAGGVVVGLAAGPIIALGGYGAMVLCSAALIASAAICLVLSDRILGPAPQAAPAT